MIKVNVELWPYGSVVGKKQIASMVIGNDGTGTKELGNYKIKISETKYNGSKKVRTISVTGHERDKGIWVLISRILDKIELAKPSTKKKATNVMSCKQLSSGNSMSWVSKKAGR